MFLSMNKSLEPCEKILNVMFRKLQDEQTTLIFCLEGKCVLEKYEIIQLEKEDMFR